MRSIVRFFAKRISCIFDSKDPGQDRSMLALRGEEIEYAHGLRGLQNESILL